MHRLDEWIRGLSGAAEITVVVVVAFGWFTVASVWSFVAGLATSHGLAPMTEQDFIEIALQEAMALAILAWFLRQRGWTLARLGLAWSSRPAEGSLTRAIACQVLWGAGLVGAGLVFAAWLPWAVITAILPVFVPQWVAATPTSFVAPGIGIAVVLTFCLLNPIFEEVFVCGYLVSKLAPARTGLGSQSMSARPFASPITRTKDLSKQSR
jgi:hypothetical protein